MTPIFSLFRSIFLHLELTLINKSSSLSLGFGKNFDLNVKNLGDIILSYTQLTSSLSAVKNKSDLTSFRILTQSQWNNITKTKNFNTFSLGLRTISNFDIELGAKYNRLAGNGINFDQLELEAIRNFSNNLAVGARVTTQKNGSKTGLFLRTSF